MSDWLDTWKCHICGRERPDAAISVWKTERPLGNTGATITENVRYCNDDDPSCAEQAKTYTIFPDRA